MSVHRRPPVSHVRFTIALVLVAVGAAIFAVGFRTSLALAYRDVFNAGTIVEAIRHLPFRERRAQIVPNFTRPMRDAVIEQSVLDASGRCDEQIHRTAAATGRNGARTIPIRRQA